MFMDSEMNGSTCFHWIRYYTPGLSLILDVSPLGRLYHCHFTHVKKKIQMLNEFNGLLEAVWAAWGMSPLKVTGKGAKGG